MTDDKERCPDCGEKFLDCTCIEDADDEEQEENDESYVGILKA